MRIIRNLIIALMIVFIGSLIWNFLIEDIIENETNKRNYCEQEGLEDCYYDNVRCHKDCEKRLGLEYFRFDSGGFSSDECWCKLNNETKQIW